MLLLIDIQRGPQRRRNGSTFAEFLLGKIQLLSWRKFPVRIPEGSRVPEAACFSVFRKKDTRGSSMNGITTSTVVSPSEKLPHSNAPGKQIRFEGNSATHAFIIAHTFANISSFKPGEEGGPFVRTNDKIVRIVFPRENETEKSIVPFPGNHLEQNSFLVG